MQFSSFRDPAGRVFFDTENVIRVVKNSSSDTLEKFLALPKTSQWQTSGKLIAAQPISSLEELNGFTEFIGADDLVLKHPRIWFPSFPHEWPPEMLREAGALTLEMAESILDQGWSLKDATPFNVLFQGTKPIFIDLLSFEKRNSGDPIWLAYQQFVNSFLLPLFANKNYGISLRNVFLANRDGIDVEEASRYLNGLSKFGRTAFGLITLPKMLSAKAESSTDLYTKKRQIEPERAKYVLQHTLRRLRKNLKRVSPDDGRSSRWSGYTEHNVTKIPEYMAAKQNFVEDAVRRIEPKTVLDIGCNTGYFSFFAAKQGAKVVAIDHDAAVVGQVWRDADNEGLDVLPLVVDIGKPSPRLGWRNLETPSFLDRAEGRFDLVMMLAVLHHMIVSDRIPLREVLKLAADLTNNALLIEFVPPNDPLFRKIARGRDTLHTDLDTVKFEDALREFFQIVLTHPLPNSDRSIYLLNKK